MTEETGSQVQTVQPNEGWSAKRVFSVLSGVLIVSRASRATELAAGGTGRRARYRLARRLRPVEMIMELSMRFEAGNSSAASLFLACPPCHSTALSFLDTYTRPSHFPVSTTAGDFF